MFQGRKARKAEDYGADDGAKSSGLRVFRSLKSPKSGRFRCGCRNFSYQPTFQAFQGHYASFRVRGLKSTKSERCLCGGRHFTATRPPSSCRPPEQRHHTKITRFSGDSRLEKPEAEDFECGGSGHPHTATTPKLSGFLPGADTPQPGHHTKIFRKARKAKDVCVVVDTSQLPGHHPVVGLPNN